MFQTWAQRLNGGICDMWNGARVKKDLVTCANDLSITSVLTTLEVYGASPDQSFGGLVIMSQVWDIGIASHDQQLFIGNGPVRLSRACIPMEVCYPWLGERRSIVWVHWYTPAGFKLFEQPRPRLWTRLIRLCQNQFYNLFKNLQFDMVVWIW